MYRIASYSGEGIYILYTVSYNRIIVADAWNINTVYEFEEMSKMLIVLID